MMNGKEAKVLGEATCIIKIKGKAATMKVLIAEMVKEKIILEVD